VKLCPDVVGALPALMDGRVRTDHMVVREHVMVAELGRALTVGPDGADIRPDLSLRENHADLHKAQGTDARVAGARPWRLRALV